MSLFHLKVNRYLLLVTHSPLPITLLPLVVHFLTPRLRQMIKSDNVKRK